MSEKTWLEPYKWEKGSASPNPSGRPPTPPDIKALMREKSIEYRKKFLFWCDAPLDDIQKCKNAPWGITGLDRMICSAIVKAMNGDHKAMDAVLDRILGKAIQQVDLNDQNTGLTAILMRLQQLNEKQLLEQAELARKTLKGDIVDVTDRTKK